MAVRVVLVLFTRNPRESLGEEWKERNGKASQTSIHHSWRLSQLFQPEACEIPAPRTSLRDGEERKGKSEHKWQIWQAMTHSSQAKLFDASSSRLSQRHIHWRGPNSAANVQHFYCHVTDTCHFWVSASPLPAIPLISSAMLHTLCWRTKLNILCHNTGLASLNKLKKQQNWTQATRLSIHTKQSSRETRSMKWCPYIWRGSSSLSCSRKVDNAERNFAQHTRNCAFLNFLLSQNPTRTSGMKR